MSYGNTGGQIGRCHLFYPACLFFLVFTLFCELCFQRSRFSSREQEALRVFGLTTDSRSFGQPLPLNYCSAREVVMSMFMILGIVCCVCAASSTLLVGLFQTAPLAEDYDARPKHRHANTTSRQSANLNRNRKRSHRAGSQVFADQAHTPRRRRAVPLPR